MQRKVVHVVELLTKSRNQEKTTTGRPVVEFFGRPKHGKEEKKIVRRGLVGQVTSTYT